MTLTKAINKNQELRKKNYRDAIEPQAQNPVYKLQLNYLGCIYCHPKKGRKKKFKTLWSLHTHHVREHPNENHRELIMNLANLIIKRALI